MFDKIKAIGKAAKLPGKAKEAHTAFVCAKKAGEVSLVKELAVGVAAPGAAWLMIRGTVTPIVAAFLAGLVQTIDPFVAADLSLIITEKSIDGASTLLVSAGVLWGAIDWMRSNAGLGLFPQSRTDKP